jgi:hypothetical protein
MQSLVTSATQALQFAKPKLHGIAVVLVDVVDDVSRDDEALCPAGFAQRLRPKLVAPSTSPTSMVVGAAAIVAALAAALGVQAVRITHGASSTSRPPGHLV